MIVPVKVLIDEDKLHKMIEKIVKRRVQKILKEVLLEKRERIRYELHQTEFRREPV